MNGVHTAARQGGVHVRVCACVYVCTYPVCVCVAWYVFGPRSCPSWISASKVLGVVDPHLDGSKQYQGSTLCMLGRPVHISEGGWLLCVCDRHSLLQVICVQSCPCSLLQRVTQEPALYTSSCRSSDCHVWAAGEKLLQPLQTHQLGQPSELAGITTTAVRNPKDATGLAQPDVQAQQTWESPKYTASLRYCLVQDLRCVVPTPLTSHTALPARQSLNRQRCSTNQ